MSRPCLATITLLASFLPSAVQADDAQLRKQAATALRKATDFFTTEVSTEGGYLWQYSEDLATREGEGRAADTVVWVQPPGTPTVGMAFLEAYRDTGDKHYLEAAKKAGYCLVRGQLRSGGWDYRIEFDPKGREKYAYRVDEPVKGRSQRNTTTLDDNTTQAALRLLMQLDKTLDFKDAAIHETVEYALKSLLDVQYPIGAWPQRFVGPPDADKYPVKKASYPDSWSWEYPKVSYSTFYTFNDNAMNDVIDIMFMASDVYEDERYSTAAERCGDFIIMAQMPEPQPAWAQQYDTEMHPAWARRFEPPSITGGESQGVMRALLQLYRYTGDKKFLEPIPRAVEYFRRSELPGGQLARFYELKTNKPLFFTKDYKLTYSDADMPTHYSFKQGSGMDRIERDYKRLLATDPAKLKPSTTRSRSKASKSMMQQVEKVIAALDDQGRWVQDGRMRYHGDDDPTIKVINCGTFCANLRVLSRYLGTAAD